MSNEEEGGMKRKEGRGESSDEEEGATGRVKKMKEKLLKNKEKKVARGRIVDPRGLVSVLKSINPSQAWVKNRPRGLLLLLLLEVHLLNRPSLGGV